MKSNTALILILTLLIAAGAYWYFFTRTGNEQPLSPTDITTSQAQAQFQTLVGELQPITFDTSIFSDPRFNALVDLSVAVSPEPAGRLDPLAPIPGVVGH